MFESFVSESFDIFGVPIERAGGKLGPQNLKLKFKHTQVHILYIYEFNNKNKF